MTTTTARREWSAESLRAHRTAKGLTQADMARLLAIRENSYGRLERGQTAITPRMALLMRKVLGLPPK